MAGMFLPLGLALIRRHRRLTPAFIGSSPHQPQSNRLFDLSRRKWHESRYRRCFVRTEPFRDAWSQSTTPALPGHREDLRALDGAIIFRAKGQSCSNKNVETTLPQYHLPAK
jgi:hypothetical protein